MTKHAIPNPELYISSERVTNALIAGGYFRQNLLQKTSEYRLQDSGFARHEYFYMKNLKDVPNGLVIYPYRLAELLPIVRGHGDVELGCVELNSGYTQFPNLDPKREHFGFSVLFKSYGAVQPFMAHLSEAVRTRVLRGSRDMTVTYKQIFAGAS